MYKKRFKRWGIDKYEKQTRPSHRQRRPNGPRCWRNREAQIKALLHEQSSTMLVEKAAFFLRRCFLASVESDPHWRTAPRHTALTCPETAVIHEHINHGLWLLHCGEIEDGGSWLRAAFLGLESAARNPGLIASSELMSTIFFLFVYYDRPDILKIYLSFLLGLSTSVYGHHLLRHVADPLHQLAQLHGDRLEGPCRQYLYAAMDIFRDVLADRVDGHDRNFIAYSSDRARRLANFENSDPGWALKQVIADYDALLQDTIDSNDADEDLVFDMQDDLVALMISNTWYPDDNVERIRRFQGQLTARYPGVGFSTGDWSEEHSRFYLRVTIYLLGYFLSIENNERVLELLPDLLAAFDTGWEDYIEAYQSTLLELEEMLGAEGRTEDLAALQQRRLKARASRRGEISELIKDMGGLEVGDLIDVSENG